jgi:hypothetical protein
MAFSGIVSVLRCIYTAFLKRRRLIPFVIPVPIFAKTKMASIADDAMRLSSSHP